MANNETVASIVLRADARGAEVPAAFVDWTGTTMPPASAIRDLADAAGVDTVDVYNAVSRALGIPVTLDR
jgi:hypothetical protein